MKDDYIIEEGEIFNLSFDGKKRLVGWDLLITNDEREFLIRENSLIGGLDIFKIKQSIYAVDTSLKDKVMLKEGVKKIVDKRINSTSTGVGISLVVASIFRVLPNDWFFGPENDPVSIVVEIFNLLWFWTLLIVSLLCISFFRKRKCYSLFKLNNMTQPKYIGRCHRLNIKRKKVNLFKIGISVIIIVSFGLSILFILPFFVQERLFLVLVILGTVSIFYDGKLYSTHQLCDKVVIYK